MISLNSSQKKLKPLAVSSELHTKRNSHSQLTNSSPLSLPSLMQKYLNTSVILYNLPSRPHPLTLLVSHFSFTSTALNHTHNFLSKLLVFLYWTAIMCNQASTSDQNTVERLAFNKSERAHITPLFINGYLVIRFTDY